MIKAAFAEADLTPPLGTRKIGWLKDIVPTRILDPIQAHVAVIETPRGQAAFISLDTLFVRAEETAAIRSGVEHQFGFPPASIMVAATHNHGGPAVAECGDVRTDESYCRTMVEKCVRAVGEALSRLESVEIAIGRQAVFGVSHNRRVMQRDGLVKTHGTFDDPNALYLEGPIDPTLTVVGFRRLNGGGWLGSILNFTNHPADHGGDDVFSAGWPGVLSREMKSHGLPVTVFLNGAYGNIASPDPTRGNKTLSMEETGTVLAGQAAKVLEQLSAKPELFLAETDIGCRSQTVRLSYRRVTAEEIRGTIRGAQRFIDPAIYDRNIPRVLAEIKAHHGRLQAEVQVITFAGFEWVGVPCELFVELGFQIKEKAHPRRALIVGSANGIIGYVPHEAAFRRGGYETTFLSTSKVAPGTGERLVAKALELIRQGRQGS